MNKLEELVYSMSIHDQKAFENYLASPFFTTNKSLPKLFREILKGKKNRVEKSLQVKTKNITQTQRYLQSELTGHLEYFFAIRLLNKQPFTLDVMKLNALAERDCEKSWSYINAEFEKKHSILNADFYYAGFAVAENQVKYLSTKQSRKKNPEFDKVNHQLDVFYYSKKLQLFCEVFNMKNLLAGEIKLPMLNELKKQSKFYIDIPVIKIYYLILLTLEEPDVEIHFTQTRNVITENINGFPAKELNEIYLYIKNYCIRKINQGKHDYILILFDIYKEILGNKKLLQLDYISQFEFKNIVSLSLRLDEQAWCRNFISNYIIHLHPDQRKNAHTYNSAYLHFANSNFKNAIRLLQEVEFTDIVYQLDARVILLKCYFEMNDTETFFYHASAFRLFLLRNRHISDYQKTINRNLIKYLTRMVRDQYNLKKINKLKEEITREKNIADIKWLMKKIELL